VKRERTLCPRETKKGEEGWGTRLAKKHKACPGTLRKGGKEKKEINKEKERKMRVVVEPPISLSGKTGLLWRGQGESPESLLWPPSRPKQIHRKGQRKAGQNYELFLSRADRMEGDQKQSPLLGKVWQRRKKGDRCGVKRICQRKIFVTKKAGAERGGNSISPLS